MAKKAESEFSWNMSMDEKDKKVWMANSNDDPVVKK